MGENVNIKDFELDSHKKIRNFIFGIPAPTWIKDNHPYLGKQCFSCKINFSVIRRRHHCRRCRNIFCSSCCNKKKPIFLLHNEAGQKGNEEDGLGFRTSRATRGTTMTASSLKG